MPDRDQIESFRLRPCEHKDCPRRGACTPAVLLPVAITIRPRPPRSPGSRRPLELTDRQVVLALLLVTDVAPKRIARAMGVTPRAVQAMGARVRRQLNLKGPAGLVLYAVRMGWIDLYGRSAPPQEPVENR